ncbi:hypothetical protein Lser_V15G42957 [Lactuca serriola]
MMASSSGSGGSRPPPHCGGRRRVVATKKRDWTNWLSVNNSVKKIQRREISSKRQRSVSISNSIHRFRNIRLTEQYSTHDPKESSSFALPFLTKRAKVVEIVAGRGIIFALTSSGVCAAFRRDTKKRICFLNIFPDEVIRSFFSSLKCRSTRIEYIERGKPDSGFPLFESESLKWPGFVEFDDVNGKVLTYSAEDSIYKVFDLKNYTLLYSVADKNVEEIKISPGIMLLIYSRAASHVPLKILSIEDGSVLKDFNHLLHRNKKVEFIEQFNEKLLVKQENENLQILDVRNADVKEVGRTDVSVWNFKGELVTSFEDHVLWHPDCNTNNIYITSDQDLIISFCKPTDSDDQSTIYGDGKVGSINISNIWTGKCVAKINWRNACLNEEDEDEKRKVAGALEEVTALYYDEEHNAIYTGNAHGLVHVWSN